MNKRALLILGLIAFFLALGKLWHLAKDGFSLSRALFPPLRETSWPFPPPSPLEQQQVAAQLAQPYFYLGRGHQCYAFESADGLYVLKLLRHDRYHASLLQRSLSIPYMRSLPEIHQDLSHRFECLMQSFAIAFGDLQAETALRYLHLGSRRSQALPPLSLVDAMGRHYLLDTQHVDFVLQDKKELFGPRLQAAIDAHRDEEAQHLIDLLIQFVVHRAEKGICNKDPSFFRNFGMDAGGIVQIDTGSFYRSRQPMTERDRIVSMLHTLRPVQEWLRPISPELATHLQRHIEEISLKQES